MELTDCRKRIDELDEQIAKCFEERMRISEQVGKVKRAANTCLEVRGRVARKGASFPW